ncbi:MAG: hypothetical protein IKH29_06485 [Methanobrevibacter sp.]|uniref:hypothetical protein n=1 Tax=Methanobrevibacter sp. TaxID=66852 RepID=UPI0025F803C4|nr:hypothetical protein [Methanobrevibacter sp.]MBR3113348.1 hypothetical protein [Methanobrevibacter sp.]
MDKRYLRENRNSFNIVKSSKIYAKVGDLDDAIFIRDLLVQCDWDLNRIPQYIKKDDDYLVLAIIDDKLHLLSKDKSMPDTLRIIRLVKNFKRNPNNSKYGLNIFRVFDTFTIKKQIAGDDYIFGYYDAFEDARFVRNFLLDNEWDVNCFGEIEFDDETDSYRVVSVIDDYVYVLGNFTFKSQIDLQKVYEEFLAKISKHKYGLADYPHLDLLKDRIPELEDRFHVKTKDKNWSFDNVNENESILSQVIFNLTPFQQSVYDSIDSNTSFDEIKRSLIRYKSINFENKIQRNIDELIELNLIERIGENSYSKTNS